MLASRCSSWIRKSRRLPISPPFFEQALDLVEVRVQPGQFFGDVDADRKGGGFGQGAVLRGLGQRAAVGQAHGFLPALQEACALLLHQLRHQRAACCGQRAQLRQVVQQHVGQPRAFALAGGHRSFSALPASCSSVAAQSTSAVAVAGGQAQDVGDAQARASGSQAVTLSCTPLRRCSSGRWARPHGCGAAALDGGAQLDLAAFELPASSSRSAGSCWRRSSGSLKLRSRKRLLTERISRPSAACRGLPRLRCGAGARALLAAGVAGHAVNWHTRSFPGVFCVRDFEDNRAGGRASTVF